MSAKCDDDDKGDGEESGGIVARVLSTHAQVYENKRSLHKIE